MTERLEEIFDPPPDDPQIEIGTAGWDDREEHFEKGEVTDDGHDFVFVTLYRGRDASKRPLKGVASGYKIRCTLAEHCPIPKKGARVYVALPAGYGQIPGAGVIFAVVGPGLGRFTNLKDNAKTFTSPNGTVAIVLNDDGVAVIRTKTTAGYDIYWRLAPDSQKFVAPWGTERSDATGWSWVGPGGATMNLGSIGGIPAPFDSLSTYFRVQAGFVGFKCSAARFGVGPADRVAKSTPSLILFTALVDAIAKVNAAAATAPGYGASGAGALATSSLASLATTMSAAPDVIPAIVASE